MLTSIQIAVLPVTDQVSLETSFYSSETLGSTFFFFRGGAPVGSRSHLPHAKAVGGELLPLVAPGAESHPRPWPRPGGFQPTLLESTLETL